VGPILAMPRTARVSHAMQAASQELLASAFAARPGSYFVVGYFSFSFSLVYSTSSFLVVRFRLLSKNHDSFFAVAAAAPADSKATGQMPTQLDSKVAHNLSLMMGGIRLSVPALVTVSHYFFTVAIFNFTISTSEFRFSDRQSRDPLFSLGAQELRQQIAHSAECGILQQILPFS